MKKNKDLKNKNKIKLQIKKIEREKIEIEKKFLIIKRVWKKKQKIMKRIEISMIGMIEMIGIIIELSMKRIKEVHIKIEGIIIIGIKNIVNKIIIIIEEMINIIEEIEIINIKVLEDKEIDLELSL